MTDYRVFRRGSGGDWVLVGTVPAHSAKQAIALVVDGMGEKLQDADGQTFAATPERSWTQLTVSVAVETRVRVG